MQEGIEKNPYAPAQKKMKENKKQEEKNQQKITCFFK